MISTKKDQSLREDLISYLRLLRSIYEYKRSRYFGYALNEQDYKECKTLIDELRLQRKPKVQSKRLNETLCAYPQHFNVNPVDLQRIIVYSQPVKIRL